MFEKIQLSTILNNHESSDKIQKHWANFIDVIGDLKLDFCSDDEIINLKGKIGNWQGYFLNFYDTKDVTPYMDAFYSNIPELLNLYTNNAHYTQQLRYGETKW